MFSCRCFPSNPSNPSSCIHQFHKSSGFDGYSVWIKCSWILLDTAGCLEDPRALVPLRTYRTGANGHRWRPVRPSLPVRRSVLRWSMAVRCFTSSTSVLKSGCITTRPRLKTLGRIEMNSADILLVCFHAECRKEEHASSSISRLQLTAVQPTWVCMCKNEIATHVYQLIGNFISKPVSKSVLRSVASIILPWHGSEF